MVNIDPSEPIYHCNVWPALNIKVTEEFVLVPNVEVPATLIELSKRQYASMEACSYKPIEYDSVYTPVAGIVITLLDHEVVIEFVIDDTSVILDWSINEF
jgi:hypothetical protein